MACSTCHVILDPEVYDQLPEPEVRRTHTLALSSTSLTAIQDDENDMLDMAFGLTDTSRLGCQVRVTKAFDGMNVTLPAATRNMFVDGSCSSSFLAAVIYSFIPRQEARPPLVLVPEFRSPPMLLSYIRPVMNT